MIAKLKFPFTVKRVTSIQDEYGNLIESDESWSSYCDYKQISTGTKVFLGLAMDIEAIDITYKFWPGREMIVNDLVTVLGKSGWTHFGRPKFDSVGHTRYITQSLRHG